MGFSDLLATIGGMGHFQVLQIVLMLIPGMLFACQNFLQNFIAVVPEHHCRIQNQTSAEPPFLGDGRDRDLLKVSIPMDKAGKPERCLRFTGPQWQLLNPNASEQARPDTEGCLDGWVYDKSVFSSSIVTKWDLVCERKLLVPVARIIFVGGQLAGSIVFGILSDRFGRRKMLRWSSLLVAIAGTGAAFVPTFAAYVIFRFFLAIALIGNNLTRFCLAVEWTPIEKRVLVHTCNMYAFTFGKMLLSGWAYLIPEWHWLQFSISASFGIVLLFSLALPESARWLITHNKLHMALKALQKVAWINGHKEEGKMLTPEIILNHIQEDLATVKPKSSFRDIVRTPGLRKTTFCIMFGWAACGFSFYALSLDIQKFGLNIYLVQVIFALIDFPARLLTSVSISYLGNRFTLIFCAVLTGSMFIIDIFVPQDKVILRLIVNVIAKGNVGGLISCFYLYTMELYPTEIRQMGLSVGNMSIRFGSLLSPFAFIITEHSPVGQRLLFAIIYFLSAISACFLIETHGLPLLDTIQEMENRIKRLQAPKGNASQDVQERPGLLTPETAEAESPV